MGRMALWVTLVGALLVGAPTVWGLGIVSHRQETVMNALPVVDEPTRQMLTKFIDDAVWDRPVAVILDAADVPAPIREPVTPLASQTDAAYAEAMTEADAATTPADEAASEAEDEAAPKVPEEATEAVSDVVETADEAVATAKETVATLTCPLVVRVVLDGYGGTAAETRPGEIAFLSPRALEEDLIRETDGTPVGQLLAPILGDAFGEAEAMDADDADMDDEQPSDAVPRVMVDVGVHATWTEQYVTWTHIQRTFFLDLPAGLPYLLADQGDLVRLCAEGVQVGTAAPEFDERSEFDLWSPVEQRNGWYAQVTTVEARLAEEEDRVLLPDETAAGLYEVPALVQTAIASKVDYLLNTLEETLAALAGQVEDAPPALDASQALDPAFEALDAAADGSPAQPLVDVLEPTIEALAADVAGLLDPENLPATLDQLLATVQGALDEVDVAGSCRDAVAIRHEYWGSTVTDRRERRLEFHTDRLVPIDVLTHVEVPAAARVANGLPLVETAHAVVADLRTLAIRADWREEYVQWERVEDVVLVTLPVGLPQVDAGLGVFTRVCDPDQPLVETTQADTSRYESVWLLPTTPQNGWRMTVDAITVRLASASDMEELPDEEESGYRLHPLRLIDMIEREIAAFRGFLETWEKKEAVPEDAPKADAAAPRDAEPEPDLPQERDDREMTYASLDAAPTRGVTAASLTWVALLLLGIVGGAVGQRWLSRRGAK